MTERLAELEELREAVRALLRAAEVRDRGHGRYTYTTGKGFDVALTNLAALLPESCHVSAETIQDRRDLG